MKNNLIVFENAMCCSTGVCGPEPDKTLILFNETIKKLQKEFGDWQIIRASLSGNPNLFLENKEVFELVKQNGQDILPIVWVNGKITAKGQYPDYPALKGMIEEALG